MICLDTLQCPPKLMSHILPLPTFLIFTGEHGGVKKDGSNDSRTDPEHVSVQISRVEQVSLTASLPLLA